LTKIHKSSTIVGCHYRSISRIEKDCRGKEQVFLALHETTSVA